MSRFNLLYRSFIAHLRSFFYSPSISPDSPSLSLIFIHDSKQRGMYHVSPSIDHLAHALGCCTVENVDDALLTVIATVQSSSVTPTERLVTHKLTDLVSFNEAQRVLSQAKASEDAPSSQTLSAEEYADGLPYDKSGPTGI